MQIKTIVRYHSTSIWMAKIHILNNTTFWEGCRALILGNLKWYSHTRRQLTVSYKSKHSLSILSSNHAPMYVLKWYENLYYIKTYSKYLLQYFHSHQKLIATYKNLNRLIDKLWYTHIREYYSVIKENHQATRRNKYWTPITLWKKFIWRCSYCMILITWHYVKVKTIDTVRRSMVLEVREEGRGLDRWNSRLFFSENWNYLYNNGIYMTLLICEYP